MDTKKPLQIFKLSKHTAMSGAVLSFSESDLAATAAAYDVAKHEAPLVCGHPKHNEPAYGWVSSLTFADGGLDANPVQVDAAFAEMVANGSFKKISASFYSPDAPGNPVPGVYYLKHVGFLGAMPPAVKGMRTPSFADSEEGVVEFAEWDDVMNSSVLRSLRDWIIGKFGLDDADKAIPGYQVQSLELSAQKELEESMKEDQSNGLPAPSFTESQSLGDEMSAEEKTRLATLEAENAVLKAQQVAFAEAEKIRKNAAVHADNTSFAEGLVKDGKLLPVHKDVVVAQLDFISAQDNVVEFGEGDAKKPLADAFRAMLQAQGNLVNFGETAKPESASATVDFAAAPGYGVNADSMESYARAQAYMLLHKVDFETAVSATQGV
jgi:hypothetical protein